VSSCPRKNPVQGICHAKERDHHDPFISLNLVVFYIHYSQREVIYGEDQLLPF